jgi:hypothetical protein
MFKVSYCDTTGLRLDVEVDAVRLLTLLEAYSTGKTIKYMTVTYQGKSIDCNKLLRSLKFV